METVIDIEDCSFDQVLDGDFMELLNVVVQLSTFKKLNLAASAACLNNSMFEIGTKITNPLILLI